ncbi:MAG: hypothetical protein QNK18_00860, partial [Gammaproteobacteria bacterium]|nr:hypothetical protein [Gammaproteobacteria bacterium]
MRPIAAVAFAALLLVAHPLVASAEDPEITKTWAIAEFGEPLHKEGLEHWPYVKPDAPKGG